MKWDLKGGFQLIQILGLLGMYFDTVVAEVFFTFIQIGSGHTVEGDFQIDLKNRIFAIFTIFKVYLLRY